MQIGASIVALHTDRDFVYVIGGMTSEREIVNSCTQVRLNSTLHEDPLNKVMHCARLPEPRFCHGSVTVRGSIVVVGGLSSFSVSMGMLSEPPCKQRVFQLDFLRDGIDARNPSSQWKELPSMGAHASLHPTLIVVKNRFIY